MIEVSEYRCTYDLLDHGYVKYQEHWGSDETVIEAARMSLGKGFMSWLPYEGHPTGDSGLLRHLWTKKHTSPFEQCGLTIEVKCPIFVLREWHRHRTQSYSEMSARYTPLPDENYIPTVERLMMNSKTNKQAGTVAGSKELTEQDAEIFRDALDAHYQMLEKLYQSALRVGVPKELARIHLPVGRYSRMRASANLVNWFRFLSLRLPEDAQYEIRIYAEAVGEIIKHLFPRTWELFAEGRK